MADLEEAEIVDLSHVIEHGMTTYKGLPPPHICDFWERESTAANYDDGSTFQIGRIDMLVRGDLAEAKDGDADRSHQRFRPST